MMTRLPALLTGIFLSLLTFSLRAQAPAGPEVTIAIDPATVCSPAPRFHATVLNGGTSPRYQWQVNGANAGANSSAFSQATLTYGDVVRCLVTAGTATATSNSILMQGAGEVAPEVVVTASTDIVCAGTPVTFTASNKNGSLDPSYAWTVSGQPAGTNSPTFYAQGLADGAVVLCRMTVPQCSGGTTKDDSDPVTIRTKQVLQPSVTITAVATTVCEGSPAVFTARPMDAGAQPHYAWRVNGLPAGGNEARFTTTTLKQGDEVNCILTADLTSACFAHPVTRSNSITMTVTPPLVTTLKIEATGNGSCEGTPVLFRAVAGHAGASPAYQWEVNGVRTGTNSPTFTSALLKEGDVVQCILSATHTPCAVTSTHASNLITVSVLPRPSIVIRPADTTIHYGTQAQLKAELTGAANAAWTPAASLLQASVLEPYTIPLRETTVFKLKAVSPGGCVTEEEARVRVVQKLYMPNSFTPNGDGRNDIFRIPANVHFRLKEFSVFDRWGNRIFTTTDINKGWDGNHKGMPLDPNTYVYMITGWEGEQETVLKGTVVLLH